MWEESVTVFAARAEPASLLGIGQSPVEHKAEAQSDLVVFPETGAA
jgi:hypothetical protein